MIAEILNRGFLLAQLEEVKVELARLAADPSAGRRRADGAELPEVEPAAYGEALDAIERVERVEAEGARAAAARRGSTGAQPSDEIAFISRDPVLSLLQSALEEQIEERQPADLVEEGIGSGRRRGADDDDLPEISDTHLRGYEGATGRRLGRAFEVTDIRWVSSVIAHGLRRWTDKHPFNPKPAPPAKLGKRAKVVMVGDWGSGIKRAIHIGELMREHVEEGLDDDVDVHVVHLGDVYYSGFAREYKKRFLPHWPVDEDQADRVGSWCLNGNHDMYSGGYGYFDHLLADPRFARHAGSSWFTIENEHWRLAGLDTAWDEVDLHDPRRERGLQAPQAEHVARWAKKGEPNLLLMSHHQLFSAYEHIGPYLGEVLAPALKEGIKAWFWGHEHKATAYEPFRGVEFGRCLGHGGVPVYPSGEPDEDEPATIWYEDGVFTGLLEEWTLFGFAVLDFDGADLDVRYFDERGDVSFTESIS